MTDLLSDKDLNIEILIYLLCRKMTFYPSNHLTGRHYNYAFSWFPIFPSVSFLRDYKSSDSQTGLPLQQHICSNQCMCSDWFFLDHFFKLKFLPSHTAMEMTDGNVFVRKSGGDFNALSVHLYACSIIKLRFVLRESTKGSHCIRTVSCTIGVLEILCM